MSDNQKTGFAAIDAKANASDPSPAEVTEANSQAKNEHTETKDDTLGMTEPNIPENLQTTSAHRNDEANANTIGEVKATHDAALEEVRDGLATLRHDLEAGLLQVQNKIAELSETAKVVSSDETAESSLSLAMHNRLAQIEKAVGIRPEMTPAADEGEPA